MSASTLRGACGGPLLLPRSLKLVGLLASVVPLHQAREARGGCWGSQDEQGADGGGTIGVAQQSVHMACGVTLFLSAHGGTQGAASPGLEQRSACVKTAAKSWNPGVLRLRRLSCPYTAGTRIWTHVDSPARAEASELVQRAVPAPSALYDRGSLGHLPHLRALGGLRCLHRSGP